MRLFAAIVRHDLRRGMGGAVLPVVFFLLVATLYPFAVGPDGAVLARTGGGVLWVAALLAALLPIERLVTDDWHSGVLDQYRLRGASDEGVALAKMCAHWLGFGPALMLATIIAAALLRLDGETVWRLETGLAIGTPALAALGVFVAALTAGLKRAGALAGLLMLPLAVPTLIFGAGSLGASAAGLKLLAATTLMLVATMPFAAGAALKSLRQ